MSLALSTKVELLSLLDDIEILTKGLFEALAAKNSGGPELNCHSLVEHLRQKEAELQRVRAQAAQQQAVQAQICRLRAHVEQRDQEIAQFQRHMKEADRLLTVAIFYSRQKLESMQTARQNPVESEELVKFAHKISASNGVMAPLGWGVGDPRRPYPTATEMERGFLKYIDETGHFKQDIEEAVARSTSDRTRASNAAVAGADAGPSAQTRAHIPSSVSRPDEVDNISTDSSSSSSSED